MLRILPYILLALFLTFLISQVAIPLFKGTVLFPFIRKEHTDLEDQIVELRTKIEEAKLSSVRNALQQELDVLIQKNSSNPK